MRILLLIFLSLFILHSCTAQDKNSDFPPRYVDTTKSFITDIPKFSYGANPGPKSRLLGLDNLEKGFNNLQIRIWYDHSLVRFRQLVVIKNIDSIWTATVYKILVNESGGKLAPKYETRSITLPPKSGWKTFMKNLIKLNIMTLPDCTQIKGYNFGEDGTTYVVELATKNTYSYYSYWEPVWANKKFWQARYMGHIIALLEKELGVSKQFKDYH